MLILSLNTSHDSSVVVAEDYRILAALQKERVTRVKGDKGIPNAATIEGALSEAGVRPRDIDALLIPHAVYPTHYFSYPLHRALGFALLRLLGETPERNSFAPKRRKQFNPKKIAQQVGMREETVLHIYSHHLAHALSALFFTDWESALLYTADGGGENVNYSAYHLHDESLDELYGPTRERSQKNLVDSVGRAYGYMTEALGYRRNRHEGKLTGLSAYGEPEILDKLSKHFHVSGDGKIHSDFATVRQMREGMFAASRGVSPENCAASIQRLLENLVLASIRVYLRRTGVRHVGLAGGVFANVTLNRLIAELPEVDEVFIFPAMTDDGIAVGGVLDFLLKRDGIGHWLRQRHRLSDVYWGPGFDHRIDSAFSVPNVTRESTGTPAEAAARLLANQKVVAIYCGRTEFGPRALGARSILMSPSDAKVNDKLNQRLNRTEFMPFAPVILEEDAEDVFDVNRVNRYAMRFMTITCPVKKSWRTRIPAAVHVDGTARPQIIRESDNPLYASILRAFKSLTGLPVLVNTSFNAHEEPIVNTPEECLRALQDRRVDHVVTKLGVYSLKR